MEYNDRVTTFADNVTAEDPRTGLFDEELHKKFSRYTSLETPMKFTRIAAILEKKLGPVDSRISYQYRDDHWSDDALFGCCANVDNEPVWARYRDETSVLHNFLFYGVIRFGEQVSHIANFGFSRESETTTHVQIINFSGSEGEYGTMQINDPPRNITFIHSSANNVKTTDRITSGDFWSAYGNWRVKLLDERINLNGGIRYQDYVRGSENVIGNTLPEKDDDVTLFKGGVVVKILDGVNAYFGYGETFRVSTATRYIPEGSQVGRDDYLPDPGAENLEGGLHATSWDRRLNIQAAYYRLSQTGRVGGGTSSIEPIVPLPDNTNKGFELQVTAEPLENLLVVGSLTSVDITNADGTRTPDYAEFVANYYMNYTFTEGSMADWSFGIGMNHYGEKVPTSQPSGSDGVLTNWMIPAVTTVDISAAYERGPWRFAFNGRNLTDELYVTRFGSSVLAVWVNEGRSWSLSTTYGW